MMDLRNLTRKLGFAVTLLSLSTLAGCSSGGGSNNNGGGGGGGTTTATLKVTPSAFSPEAKQVVTLTPTVTNLATPAYTYTLELPTSLQTATAAEQAAKFGVLDSATAKFTAGDSAQAGLRGSVVVKETTKNLQFEVPIVIVPFINNVTITPDGGSVLAGQTLTFAAGAFDIDNNPLSTFVTDWRVTGGIGSIDANGVFKGSTAGEGTVTAKVGGADLKAVKVTVVGSVTGLVIRPSGNPVEVEAGTTRQFAASLRDADGNEVAVSATWQVDAAVGTINSAGLLTAGGTAGATGTLKATASGQSTTLPLKVVPLLTPPSGPANITGTIKTSAGAAAAGALVELRKTGETAVAASGSTSATGSFRLLVPAGAYTLKATLGAATVSRTFTLPSADVVLSLNLTLAP